MIECYNQVVQTVKNYPMVVAAVSPKRSDE